VLRRSVEIIGQSGGSTLFENVATVEMTFEIEMIVDRSMN
jgi:hypothetical protein